MLMMKTGIEWIIRSDAREKKGSGEVEKAP